ncbi:glycoside hydrolase family 99-like domain-containing protein [uncultured Sphingobacterium sp.]|uniref:glycoside hydrolase family 99-like domain-containing protein n=1 Tax=uncultured Sphingobacterium sp. TaxID=182688 RepID=UPI0025FF8453|nr:glycoside hydrolase family 99-like domain-containing protein [uncultured Sphingobacterium sp.]
MSLTLKYRLLVVLFFLLSQVSGQVQYGAYYFDGWSRNSDHITPLLKSEFSEREPIWGWETSSQGIVDRQIACAANAGLRFFSFCWYAGNPLYLQSKDNALAYYLSSPEKSKLAFCLLIANHEGHLITPENWEKCTAVWLKLFQDPSYLKADGKPLLIFFSVGSLLRTFGSVQSVKAHFDKMRMEARSIGLEGVTIALCASPDKRAIDLAERVGFDVITQYNNHFISLDEGSEQKVNINKLVEAEPKFWTAIKNQTKLPVIPTITLNWDPRPWTNSFNKYDSKPYYEGFNSRSVYRSVLNCNRWLINNKNNTLKENIALIYAWNENGEGAYLTPTKKEGDKKLKALKRAIARMK